MIGLVGYPLDERGETKIEDGASLFHTLFETINHSIHILFGLKDLLLLYYFSFSHQAGTLILLLSKEKRKKRSLQRKTKEEEERVVEAQHHVIVSEGDV